MFSTWKTPADTAWNPVAEELSEMQRSRSSSNKAYACGVYSCVECNHVNPPECRMSGSNAFGDASRHALRASSEFSSSKRRRVAPSSAPCSSPSGPSSVYDVADDVEGGELKQLASASLPDGSIDSHHGGCRPDLHCFAQCGWAKCWCSWLLLHRVVASHLCFTNSCSQGFSHCHACVSALMTLQLLGISLASHKRFIV